MLLLVTIFSFFLQNPYLIFEGQEEVILSITDVAYFEDTTNTLDFDDVSDSSFQKYYYNTPEFKPEDYNRSSTYWVKLDLQLPAYNGNYVLEFYDQSIDSITVHLAEVGGDFRIIRMGDALPFDLKDIHHKNFEVLLESDAKYTCYIKVKNSQYADIRIAIKRIDRFIQYSLSEYMLYGLFYGMILIISLYNLLIFLAIKERKYLYYMLYILSVGLYAMCVDGIAYQYLWPNMPNLNQYAYGVALFSIIFWSILFSLKFLNVKQRAPRLYKVLYVVFVIRIAFFMYALVFDHQLFQLRNIEIVPLSLIFISSIAVLIRGYKPARFFVLAYGFLFVGFILKALLMQSIIPFSIITYYSLHICFILEMLFLTYALSDRVRILKANRDMALKRIVTQHEDNLQLINRINRDLERQVEERTKDLYDKNHLLEASNEQIIQQSNEIAEINSMLDLDNWKLKNNIDKIQRERLSHKNLDFNEFKEVFGGSDQCLKILASYKWHSGYSCQKCDNDKYIDNKDNYSRRCTKCGYNESPTAFTTFKGIKFPLSNAFYIVYSYLNEDEFTLDELSQILEMRRNTVWQFRKKIEEEINANGKGFLNAVLSYGYERSQRLPGF
ncbi:MAG: hypothetical protein ACJAT1_001938 [Marivirga sp.]|jgi:hypothetical protein